MIDSETLDPKALERLREWGGEKLLAQMIRLFLENAPTRMAQIRTGVVASDLKEAEKGAHSLKSSAANVGLQRVRELAADAERAAAGGDAASAAQLLASLEDAFDRGVEALASVERGLSP